MKAYSKYTKMKTKILRSICLSLTVFGLLILTAQTFGQKSAQENLFYFADHQVTFFTAVNNYDSSWIDRYHMVPAGNNLIEEESYRESGMVIPFESVISEETLAVESWMTVPFPVEEELPVESWMTDGWI